MGKQKYPKDTKTCSSGDFQKPVYTIFKLPIGKTRWTRKTDALGQG
jgi:hypothetical protein